MRFFRGLLLSAAAATVLPLVLADVEFTQPEAGSVVNGTSLFAAWKESGRKPAISTFSSFQLFLCAGGNEGGNNETTNYTPVWALQPYATYNEGDSWTGAMDMGWGANNTNAYFLKSVSTSACGGTIINFSSRFTLSSMTGSFSAKIIAGLQTIGNTTNGPPTDQTGAGPALSCTSSVSPEPTGTASAASTVFVSSAAQPTSTDTSTAIPIPPTLSGQVTLPAAVLAGIIIGSIVIFSVISALAFLIFRRIRRGRVQGPSPKSSSTSLSSLGKQMERLDSTDEFAELAETAVCKELEADKRQPTELSTMMRAELPARRSIYEMPGS